MRSLRFISVAVSPDVTRPPTWLFLDTSTTFLPIRAPCIAAITPEADSPYIQMSYCGELANNPVTKEQNSSVNMVIFFFILFIYVVFSYYLYPTFCGKFSAPILITSASGIGHLTK